MSLKSNAEYWAERFAALEEEVDKHSKEYIKNAQTQFGKSLNTIKNFISRFYHQFSDITELSLAESKKALDKGEMKAFKMSVDDYIKKGESLDTDFDPEVLRELKKASLRVRISRYEAIQWQIMGEIARLHAGLQQTVYDCLAETYENRYYQTAYEMRGLGFSFSKINKKQINEALKKPWSETHFSDTIWRNQKKLQQNLTDSLTQSVMLGRSYNETIKQFDKKMQAGASNAARIITTESAAIAGEAQKDMFNDLGCDQYIIVATLDRRTSQICQSLDGQVYEMKDYQVGKTAPPFHPNCRTTTAPYFDDMPIPQRVARINGKSVYVDNMNYREWAKEYGIDPVYGLWEPSGKVYSYDDQYYKMRNATGQTTIPEYHEQRNRLIENSPKYIQKLFHKFQGSFVFKDYNFKGRIHFSVNDNPKEEGMFLNYKEDIKGTGTYKPFERGFHETGHYIDYLLNRTYGNGDALTPYSYNYKNNLLSRTVLKEAEEAIYEYAKENKIFVIGTYKPDLETAVSEFRKKIIKEIPDKRDRAVLSDLFEPITLKLAGVHAPFGSGHYSIDPEYWENPMAHATESMAAFISTQAANERSFEILKEYFPKGYKIFLEMIESVL